MEISINPKNVLEFIIRVVLSFTFLLFLLSNVTHALVSVQNTISGGYYRDISESSHTTLYYNMKMNHISSSGSELYFDLGLNNNFVQDEWGVYPYQAYFSVPLSDGFEDAPHYQSRFQVGRTFLTEAFYADVFDGVYSNYYLKSRTWTTLFAGGLHVPEEMETDFEDTTYGMLVSRRHFYNDIITKFGPIYEKGESENRALAHLSVMAPFDSLPLSPIIIFKEQFDFEKSNTDQMLAEIEFVQDKFNFELMFSNIRPNSVLLRKRREIYEIISISKQKNIGAGIQWHGPIDLTLRGAAASYDSIAGSEDGIELEVGAGYWINNFSLNPYVMYTDSFGGSVLDFGFESSYKYDDSVDFILNGSVASVDKVNGIYGWATHFRGGVDYLIERYWKTLFALEFEKNYRFEFDAKAVVYLTHYYY